MKTFIVITSLALLAIGIIFFLKGCPNPTPSKDKVIDSLKWVIRTDSISGETKYKSDSSVIHSLKVALDTTATALQDARKQFNVKGSQILELNKKLRTAFIVHDTPTVYTDCDLISYKIDSIAQQKWNVDRELDRQIVLNEQLHSADSTAFADSRMQLAKTRSAYSMIAANYEVRYQQDQKDLKKAKKGKVLLGIGGGILGVAIRSIFK